MMRIFSVLILVLLTWSNAQADIHFPAMTSPVVDDSGILTSQEKSEIENWIYDFHQQGKSQIQVVIVPDLQGLDISEYSIKLVDQWKLGDKKRDDGVLFLVSTGDHKMRIEVGQGLEGALTDLQSKRILDDRVKPLFKSGQYAAGIAAGVAEIIKAVDPEYAGKTNPQPAAQPQGRHSNNLFWIIFLFFIIVSLFGRGRRSGVGPFIAGTLLGGGFGGGRGGGGGFGGGGGWGGGGGGFSGGGASSDW
jgi:uncharacterized protein